jgi:hypothetical protein
VIFSLWDELGISLFQMVVFVIAGRHNIGPPLTQKNTYRAQHVRSDAPTLQVAIQTCQSDFVCFVIFAADLLVFHPKYLHVFEVTIHLS